MLVQDFSQYPRVYMSRDTWCGIYVLTAPEAHPICVLYDYETTASTNDWWLSTTFDTEKQIRRTVVSPDRAAISVAKKFLRDRGYHTMQVVYPNREETQTC